MYRVVAILIVCLFAVGTIIVLRSPSTAEIDTPQPQIQKRQVMQPEPTTPKKPGEKRASFAVITDGGFRKFSAPMYHNLSPDVYIEAHYPNVIHIMKDGITWRQFFATLPMKVSETCLTTGTDETFCTNANGTITFYLNKQKVVNVLDKVIQDGDELSITYKAKAAPVTKIPTKQQ